MYNLIIKILLKNFKNQQNMIIILELQILNLLANMIINKFVN